MKLAGELWLGRRRRPTFMPGTRAPVGRFRALAKPCAETARGLTHRGAEVGFGFPGQAAHRVVHTEARDRLLVTSQDGCGDPAHVGPPLPLIDGEPPLPDPGQPCAQLVGVDYLV